MCCCPPAASVAEEGVWCGCNTSLQPALRPRLVWFCSLALKPAHFTLEGFTTGFIYSCFPLEIHICLYMCGFVLQCVLMAFPLITYSPFEASADLFRHLAIERSAMLLNVTEHSYFHTVNFTVSREILQKLSSHLCSLERNSWICDFPKTQAKPSCNNLLSLDTFILKYCFIN